MLSIKLYMHVLFIFISLYQFAMKFPQTQQECKQHWNEEITCSETLVPERLERHGESHLTLQRLAPQVVIDRNSVLAS